MKRMTDGSPKPYTRCLACPHRRVRCDGPRTAGLELARWCEYMRDMKEVNKLTNAYIAEASGVSVKTIEKIMAINTDQDIMRETARKIELVVLGASGKYPCFLAFEEESKPDGNKIHELYKAEVDIIREEAKERIEQFMVQIERLRKEVDYLRIENDRKARIIDKFLDK